MKLPVLLILLFAAPATIGLAGSLAEVSFHKDVVPLYKDQTENLFLHVSSLEIEETGTHEVSNMMDGRHRIDRYHFRAKPKGRSEDYTLMVTVWVLSGRGFAEGVRGVPSVSISEIKIEPNQRPDGTPVKSPPSNPDQVSGVPHP